MDAPRDKVFANALTVAATLLLALTVAFRPFKSGIFDGFEANLLFAMLIMSSACLYALRGVLLGRVQFAWTHTELPALAFGLLCVVGVFTAACKRPAFAVAVNWLAYLVLFYLVVHLSQRHQIWRLIFVALISSAVVICLYGLYQYYIDWDRTLKQFFEIKRTFGNNTRAMAEHFEKSIHVDVSPNGIADYEGRLMMRRAYSTFVLPNSFGGFLILLLPALVGYTVDLWPRRRQLRTACAIVVNALAAGLMAVSLYQTRSKGAWLCLAAAGGLWVVMLGRAWIRRRWKVVAALAIGLATLAGGLQAAGKLPGPGEYLGSFEVRMDYWRGACKIIAEHPWLGVGLNGFGDNYARHIRPEDDESVRAHNNYLQIWCEMGIGGLAAFVAFWVTYWLKLRSSRPEQLVREESNGRQRALVYLCAAAGPAALACEHWFFGWFDMTRAGWPVFGFEALLAAAWLACYAANMGARLAPGFGRAFQSGLLVGLGCFLLHSAIDIDLYVPSLTQSAWTVAGLGMGAAMATCKRCEPARTLPIPPAVGILCVALAMLIIFPIALWFMPKVMYAKLHREQARAFEEQGQHARAVDELLAAARYDRCDVRATLRLARNYWALAAKAKAPKAKLHYFGLAAQAAHRASQLNPLSASCFGQLAQTLQAAANVLRRLNGRTAQWKQALQMAAHYYRMAIARYPSKPIYHFQLAMIYDRGNQPQLASEAYRAALGLSERQRLPRNKLTEKQAAFARRRIADNEDTSAAQRPGGDGRRRDAQR